MKPITLLKHNQTTYQRVKKMWQTSKAVAVVQATGTGKSYLIARILQDFGSDRKLIIAPSKYILHQLEDHFGFNDPKTIYLTYAKASRLTQEEISAIRPKLIVLDEFHRAGAEEWGRGVLNILKSYPKVFRFGTTATPIRYLDDGRDMSKELFDGNVANDMNLAQAIAKGILPPPKYVSALYTLENIIEDHTNKIKNDKRFKGNKEAFFQKLNDIKLDFIKSRGIPTILSKHLNKTYKKLVVFCKDYKHLLAMEPLIKQWFIDTKIFEVVNTYRVVTAEPEREKAFQTFKEHKVGKSSIDLLLSVDMFNEGLHIPGVDGVILLRETESPIVFYQQIGRCLITTFENHPVIFDFVNNFNSVHASDFLNDLEYYREEEFNNHYYQDEDIEPPIFTVYDETRGIEELFGQIKFALDVWDERLEELKQYKKAHGHTNVKYRESELGRYVHKLRNNYNNGRLPKDRIEILNNLGFDWSPLESAWNGFYQQLSDYKSQYGNCRVPSKKPYQDLKGWCQKQRAYYKKKAASLSPSKIKLLEDIGFEWDYKVSNFEEKYLLLIQFKKEHGHLNVPFDYPNIGQYCRALKTKYKLNKLDPNKIDLLNKIGFVWTNLNKYDEFIEYNEFITFLREIGAQNITIKHPKWGKYFAKIKAQRKLNLLPQDKIEQLNSIGVIWDKSELIFEEKISALFVFKKEFGHTNVPRKYPKIGSYFYKQRIRFNKGKLPKHRIERLKEIGFDLDLANWQQMYAELLDYKAKFGNCLVIHKKPFMELHAWCEWIRSEKAKSYLNEEKKQRLKEIGFEWDLYKTIFNEKFKQLVEFKQKYGHVNIPNKHEELGAFIRKLRTNYKIGRLSKSNIKALNEIGFKWKVSKIKVEERYEELKHFKKEFGHANPTYAEHKQLGSYLMRLRKDYRKNNLSEKEIQLFNKLGIEWYPTVDQFNEKLLELTAFKKEYGHFKIPRSLGTLGHYAQSLRKKYSKNTLSEDKIKALEKIGFDFQPTNAIWIEMYNQLLAYKEKYGDCRPPQKGIYAKLNGWCVTQRTLKNSMPQNRKILLNNIGFDWNILDAQFDEWVVKLKEYKKEFGHLKISSSHTQLNNFATNTRANFRKGKISEERIAILNSIGFIWEP